MNNQTTPGAILTRERVDAMRSHVLGEVDRDLAKATNEPPRRAPRIFRGLAAAAAVVVIGGIGLQVFDGLGQSGGEDMGGGATTTSEAVAPQMDMEAADGRDMSVEDSGSDMVGTTEPQPKREVITTGSMEAVVGDVADVARRIEAFAVSTGGRIDARTLANPESGEWASLLVRIPDSDIDALTQELEDHGRVTNVDIAKSDVTAQSVDLDARIRSLKVSVARLQDIIADATSTRDLLATEQHLSQRQAELESLQAQRRDLGAQVELATISVELTSEESSTIEPGGFRGGLQSGWNALVDSANAVLVAIGVALPWILPILAIALILRWGWRRFGQ